MFSQVYQYIRNQFKPKLKSSVGLETEMLVRNHQEKQQYRDWIQKGNHQELLKNIYTSFTLSKLSVKGDLPLTYFQGKDRSQILLHYIDPFGKTVFPMLQDYFRDRIVRVGYQVFLSERQTVERMGYLSGVERHLLRPQVPPFSVSDKPEQLYGNIEIAVHYADERPLYLSIVAEKLNEQTHNKQYPFDELAEILFI
jgi:hypothetical protein